MIDSSIFKWPCCGKEYDLSTIFLWDENDEATVGCDSCGTIIRFRRTPKKLYYYEQIEKGAE